MKSHRRNARSAALLMLVIAGAHGVVHVGCASDPTTPAPVPTVTTTPVPTPIPGALLDLDAAPAATTAANVAFARPVAETVPAGEAVLALYEDTGLGVLDMTDAKAPELGAQITTPGKVVAVDYDEENQLAYAVDTTGTVTVIGVRSAAGAAALFSAKLPALGGEAKGLARVGRRLFVLGASKLFPALLAAPSADDDPNALTAEAPIALPSPATHIAAGGDAIYLGRSGEVQAWTVPETGAPAAGTAFTFEGDLRGLLAKGSKALVLANGSGLSIVDFANAAAPSRLQLVPDVKDVTVGKLFGRTLAVALDRGSFHTIDLSDFAKPRALTTNKGALPKFITVQNGNLFFGTGTSATAAGVPPVVAASVPSLQRQSFPLDAPIPVVFSKPVGASSVTVETVRLQCSGQAVVGAASVSDDRLTVVFRPGAALPTGASCVLDLTGVRDDLGLEISGSPKLDFKTSPTPPAPLSNPGSKHKHTADGTFNDWTPEAKTYEWFDVKAARGMYSYFYADFDGANLWLLNDWFFSGEKISPDCYNQFGVWTGGGRERWDIRAYGNKKIEVRKDGQLLDEKAAGVEGGYSFGASPNEASPHTLYELKIPAAAGTWGVQLHDPGPTFNCSQRMGDPSPLQGGLTGEGASGSTVERAPLAVPAPPSASSPQNGSVDVAVDPPPTFTWADETSPRFVRYVLEVSKDESFKRLAWRRATYGTSLRLRRGLLAPNSTYFWRVRAWSWVGSAVSPTFTFTTRGQVVQDAGVDAAMDASVDASKDVSVDAAPDGGMCGAPTCTPTAVGRACTCVRSTPGGDNYGLQCNGADCTCYKYAGEITYGGRFGDDSVCASQVQMQALFLANCACPFTPP